MKGKHQCSVLVTAHSPSFLDNYHAKRHNWRDAVLVNFWPLFALGCRVPLGSSIRVRDHCAVGGIATYYLAKLDFHSSQLEAEILADASPVRIRPGRIGCRCI